MKNTIIRIFSFLFIAGGLAHGAVLPGLLTDVFEEREGVTFEQRIQKQIEPLLAQKEKLASHYSSEHKDSLEAAYKRLNTVRKAREVKGLAETEQEFANRMALVQSETVEKLTAADQAFQAAMGALDEHIQLLESFKSDPEFHKKDLRIAQKSIYSNEDLEKLDSFILYYTDELRSLKKRLEQASANLVNRKKAVQLVTQEYEAKLKQQKALKAGESDSTNELLSIKQQGKLLDAEVYLSALKKELDETRLLEVESRQSLIENQRRIAQRQLAIVEAEYERIKPDLRIDSKDVAAAEAEYKRMLASFEKRAAELRRLISTVDFVKMAELNQIQTYTEKFKLDEGQIQAIRAWTFEASSREQWMALIAIGRLSSHIAEKQIDREDALAQIDKARALLKAEELHYQLVKTWHQLTMGRFAALSSDELSKEIKKYEMEKAEIEIQNSKTADMRAHAEQTLNGIVRIIDNIKARLKQLRDQKDTIFKEHGDEYTRFNATLMDEIYDDARRRSDKITQTIELYNSTAAIRTRTIRKIETMMNELRARAHWRDVFPFWKGLQKFIPDGRRFFAYVATINPFQLVAVNKSAVMHRLGYYRRNFSALILFVVKLLALITSFILLRLYLPDLIYVLRVLSPPYGIAKTVLSFAIATLEFINANLVPLFMLILVFVCVCVSVYVRVCGTVPSHTGQHSPSGT